MNGAPLATTSSVSQKAPVATPKITQHNPIQSTWPDPPVSHSERIASPCQEFREGAEILRVWLSGNERHAFVLPDEPILLAKGIVMQASRSPVREHRHSMLRHIVR